MTPPTDPAERWGNRAAVLVGMTLATCFALLVVAGTAWALGAVAGRCS